MYWWLMSYVGIVVTVMVIVTVQNVFCLDAAAWASWVQAIGSIGAIVGAFIILNRQQEIEAAVRRQDDKRRYAARFKQVFLIAGDASEAVDQLAALLAPERFDDPGDVNVVRRKAVAKIHLVVRRIDQIALAVSGIIRAGEVDLDHVNLLWKLNSNLHAVTQMLAGVSNPFDELDADSMTEFDALVQDIKVIRFSAASISEALSREASD